MEYPTSSPKVSPKPAKTPTMIRLRSSPAAPQVAAKLGIGNTIPPLANKLRKNTPGYPRAFHQSLFERPPTNIHMTKTKLTANIPSTRATSCIFKSLVFENHLNIYDYPNEIFDQTSRKNKFGLQQEYTNIPKSNNQ